MQASVAKARKYGQRRRISATTTATTSPPTAAAASFVRLRSGSSVYAEDAEPGRPGDEAGEPCGRGTARGSSATRPGAADDRGALGGDAHRGAARTTTTRALDVAVRVHAEHVASGLVGRAQPQGARARHARPLAEAPAKPSRLRDGQDREPLAGRRHDAVASQGEEADPDGARARARAEVAREVAGDEPQRVQALRQRLAAGRAEPVHRPGGAGAEPAQGAHAVDVELDLRPLVDAVADLRAVEATVAVRRDDERPGREGRDARRRRVDADQVRHHDRPPLAVEVDARLVGPFVDHPAGRCPARPRCTSRSAGPAGGRARARARRGRRESTISTLTRSALRSRKRISAVDVSQSQVGEKTFATVGPMIGLRVSLSFSVTTNATEVATRSAATSAAGASRDLIATRCAIPGRAARGRAGAQPPRRERSSRPPERRL